MTRGAVSLFCSILALAGPASADPFTDALSLIHSGDPVGGAAQFHALAVEGDGEAMYNLAILYHQGLGLPQSAELALYWAWRARLVSTPRSEALVARLSQSLGKDTRATVRDRLMSELRATETKEVPLSFLRQALVEQGLSAKPDQVQIYVWAAMAVAMGHVRAVSLRDQTHALLSAKDAARAETQLLDTFRGWCGAMQASAPSICAVVADAGPAKATSDG